MDDQVVKEWLNAGEMTLPRMLLIHYRDIGLDNDDLVTIIQLKSFIDQGIFFPNSQDLSERLKVSRDEAFQMMHSLIKKNVLEIQTITNEEGKTQDQLSFGLLYDKLFVYLKQQKDQEMEHDQAIREKDLYSLFEKEFGRPLSPIEIQTLNMWIDEDSYSPELIQMALREAVLSQVYSLKYIDRILLNWEKKNIKTKDQVLKESKKHRERQESKKKADDFQEDNSSDNPVPMYDWLEEYRNNSNDE